MTATPIEDGALVRLSRELTDDERSWAVLGHGKEWTVGEYVPALAAPTEDEIPVAFYEATDGHGCSVVVPAAAVEIVKTAAAMDARRPPTAQQIRDAIQGGLLGDCDTFDTDEAGPDGIDGIEAYGRTEDGLPFGFTVRVTAVWKTDL